MGQLTRITISLGVVGLLLTSTFVLSQEAKEAVPAGTTTTTIAVPEKKAEEVSKEIRKVRVRVAPVPAVPPAKAAVKAQPKQAAAGGIQAIVRSLQRAAGIQPAPVAVEVAAAGEEGAVLDPLIAQFTQQFRPVMRSELHFIRKLCEPTPDQRKSLAEQGEKALKAVATKFAKIQHQMNTGRWQWGSESPIVRQLLEELLLDNLKATFSEDQVTRYRHEINERTNLLKQVAVPNLVATLDQTLVLSTDQREKISDSLMKNWDRSWCLSLEYVQLFDQYFPNIPDTLVVPYLDTIQKNVWSGMQKNQRIFLGIANPGNIRFDESAFQEEESNDKTAESTTKK